MLYVQTVSQISRALFCLGATVALALSLAYGDAPAALANSTAILGAPEMGSRLPQTYGGRSDAALIPSETCGQNCSYQRAANAIGLQAAYIHGKISRLTQALDARGAEQSQVLKSEVRSLLGVADATGTNPNAYCRAQEGERECALRYVRIHSLLLRKMPGTLAELSDATEALRTEGEGTAIQGLGRDTPTEQLATTTPTLPTARELERLDQAYQRDPLVRKSVEDAYRKALSELDSLDLPDEELQYVTLTIPKDPRRPEAGNFTTVIRRDPTKDVSELRAEFARRFDRRFGVASDTEKRAALIRDKKTSIERLNDQNKNRSPGSVTGSASPVSWSINGNEHRIEIFQQVRKHALQDTYRALEQQTGRILERKTESGRSLASPQGAAFDRAPQAPKVSAVEMDEISSPQIRVRPGESIDYQLVLDPKDLLTPLSP